MNLAVLGAGVTCLPLLGSAPRRCGFTLAPTIFVMLATVSALVLQVRHGWLQVSADGLSLTPPVINGLAVLVLLGLAVTLAFEAMRVMTGREGGLPAGGSHGDSVLADTAAVVPSA